MLLPRVVVGGTEMWCRVLTLGMLLTGVVLKLAIEAAGSLDTDKVVAALGTVLPPTILRPYSL